MSRKSLFFLCLGAVSVYLLYEVSAWGFDWSLFLKSLRNVQPGWLAVSILATMLTYVARAFRWQVLLNRLKSVGMGPLISTNVLGFSAIFLLGPAGGVGRDCHRRTGSGYADAAHAFWSCTRGSATAVRHRTFSRSSKDERDGMADGCLIHGRNPVFVFFSLEDWV